MISYQVITHLELGVLLGRATTKSLQNLLEKKILKLKKTRSQLAPRIVNPEIIHEEVEKFYYTSWYWAAIHIATSVPELQNVNALAKRFSLPIDKVRSCLERLEKYGLVSQKNGTWVYEGGAVHLPDSSSMTELNHMHWRQRSLLDIQAMTDISLHYTSIVAMTADDANRIRELLIKNIAQSRVISDPSRSEEVFCFTLDFYRA